MYIMAILVVEFSREGYKIRKVFGSKSTVGKWNYWILRIGVVGSCQKLGIISENKVVNKLCYQKMSITKNLLLNWYFLMKKKWERFGWFLK